MFTTTETRGDDLRVGDYVAQIYSDAVIVEHITSIDPVPEPGSLVGLRCARGDRRAVYPDGTIGPSQTDHPLSAFGRRGRFTILRFAG